MERYLQHEKCSQGRRYFDWVLCIAQHGMCRLSHLPQGQNVSRAHRPHPTLSSCFASFLRLGALRRAKSLIHCISPTQPNEVTTARVDSQNAGLVSTISTSSALLRTFLMIKSVVKVINGMRAAGIGRRSVDQCRVIDRLGGNRINR